MSPALPRGRSSARDPQLFLTIIHHTLSNFYHSSMNKLFHTLAVTMALFSASCQACDTVASGKCDKKAGGKGTGGETPAEIAASGCGVLAAQAKCLLGAGCWPTAASVTVMGITIASDYKAF